ncbi:MAG TPA: DUF11 domain-containing protein, partial [Longimicrobiaceae bacterium]
MNREPRNATCLTLALLACAGALSCENLVTDPDVSDTEIWRLELEQTDDGTTVGDIARRRGTINLVLRLNHTTQADPACADATRSTITTFLATVEAPASRLQPATRGSANGSWNCFGFSGEVRLEDGTTYALTSETLAFDPLRRINLDTPMRDNGWVAEARRGHFLIAPEESFAYEPLDSHLDIRVQNRHDDEVDISLHSIGPTAAWQHHDLAYSYDRFPDLIREATVPAGSSGLVSVPSQPRPEIAPGPPPFEYTIWATMQVGPRPISYAFDCLLGPDRRFETEVIVLAPQEFECSTGWLGLTALFVDPRRLFLMRGERDTIEVATYNVETLEAEISSDAVSAAVSFARESGSGRGGGTVAVTAATGAPYTEYGVVLRGTPIDYEPDDVIEVVAVEVYDLTVDIVPDTITIVGGGTGAAAVMLERGGLAGLDVVLEIPTLPADLFLVPPAFSGDVNARDSTDLILRIDPGAPPGVYPLALCARIEADPRERCHPAEVAVRVPPVTERYDLTIATTPSNDVMTVGQEVFFNVLVSSLGGTVSTGVAATDRLPAGFSYLRHEANAGSYDPVSGEWTIGTIPAGPARTLRIYARADAAGVRTNVAALVRGIDGDVNAANDVDSTTVTVNAASGYDLAVSKTVNRDTVAAGDTVIFTLSVTNHGPGLPLGAAVRDQLPTGLAYVSDDGGGAYSPAVGLWSFGFLPAGQTRTLHIRAVATATATNTAQAVAESVGDTNTANDS